MTEEKMDQTTPAKEDQGGRVDSGSNPNSVELEPGMTTESRLVRARTRRTHAENQRQNIANEILLSTKDICQKLISEGESTLAKARHLETKAEQKHLEALNELEQAQSTREEAVVYAAQVVAEANQEGEEAAARAAALRDEADNYAEKVKAEAKQQAVKLETEAATILEEADAYAEAVISQAKNHAERVEEQAAAAREEADAYSEAVKAEAQQQAEEIVELARASADQEAAGIRQRSQDDAGKALAEVETVRAAVQQELQARQIYTESARVTVESLEVLGQIRAKLAEYSLYPETDPISESPDDDQLIVEQSGDSHSGNLTDDQLKAWLD